VDEPRRRLVWSEHGRVFAAGWTRSGPGEARELFDATTLAFEARAAPY
jgi:hypothetical protein